jgi:hypothetical protein
MIYCAVMLGRRSAKVDPPENRTASVVAHGRCTFSILRKKELFRVLITDYELWIKLQSNIIKNLAEKKMTEIISVTESHQNQTIELQ